MNTLLVFSGGGLPGLDIHAGIGMALSEFGVTPSEIHGTSAGAIYGALFAANDFSGIATERIIRKYNDDDVRDPRFMCLSRFRHINYQMRGEKIQKILADHLPESFEDLPCKLHAYTVEGGSGMLKSFSSGDLRLAVRASASIRGMFPPVEYYMPAYSKKFSDGGTKANVPLPPNWRDFDHVIICVATQPVNYEGKGLLFNALLSVHEMMESQVDKVIEEVQGNAKVTILRPPVDGKTGTMHFNHNLIDIAFDHARKVLDDVWPY